MEFFLAKILSVVVFVLLINVRIPSTVGILTFMSRMIFHAQLTLAQKSFKILSLASRLFNKFKQDPFHRDYSI